MNKREFQRRPMHSINDIKCFYENLNRDENFRVNTLTKSGVEKRFSELFQSYDPRSIENIFPIAHKNGLIKEVQEELARVAYDTAERDKLETKLAHLKNERLNAMSQYSPCMKFFTSLVLSKDYMTDLIIFENCLIEFKKDKLKELRRERIENQEKNVVLDQELKMHQAQYDESKSKEDEKIILQVKEKKNGISAKIAELDNQIDILDLTVDKFWDEIFSTYDWIIEKEKSSPIVEPDLKKVLSSRVLFNIN